MDFWHIVLIGGLAVALADILFIRIRIDYRSQVLQRTVDALAGKLVAGVSSNGLRRIMEQMPIPLVVHDRDGRVIYITPQAAAILGAVPEEIIGTTHEERGDRQDGAYTFHEFRYLVVLNGKTYHDQEITYQTPGTATRRRIAFDVAPFRVGNDIFGTVTTFRDITGSYAPRF